MIEEPNIAPWDREEWHSCTTCDEYGHLLCGGCAKQERTRIAIELRAFAASHSALKSGHGNSDDVMAFARWLEATG